PLTRPHPSSTPFPYTTLFRSHELRAYLLEPPELGDVVQHHDDAGIIGGQPQRHRIGLDGALEGPGHAQLASDDGALAAQPAPAEDRKSTRLNSSHEWISYAVF